MNFVSKYLSFLDALSIVEHRANPDAGSNPLIQALEEGALRAEVKSDHAWSAKEWHEISIYEFRSPADLRGNYRRVEPNEIRIQNVRLLREDVERCWPVKPDESRNSNRGGHPGKWDWEGAAIIMARCAILESDTTPDRPTLNKIVADWFVATTGKHPEDSDIRAHVKRFHEMIWPPKT